MVSPTAAAAPAKYLAVRVLPLPFFAVLSKSQVCLSRSPETFPAQVKRTILFQVASLGAILFRGGLLGFNQPVAALEQLRLFPYTVTLGQYVFLTLACQVFAAVVLSILLTTISALSRSSVISYAVGAIVLGGCLLLVYIPPKTEWLAGPLALSSPLKYFDSYDTANLFGFPVLWAVVQALLWCALSGVCVWLAQKVYHRKRRVL